MDDNQKKTIIFTLNRFKELGKEKHIRIYNHYMCPKAREQHLNKYKLVGYKVPEYLNINNFENIDYKNTKNIKYYIILFIILVIIIIIIICDRLNIFSLE